MPFGIHNKMLHVNLSTGTFEIEEPGEDFYRRYLGGSAMGAIYALKHTPPHADPVGPKNTLCLMAGVVTGMPISGQSRVAATAKSPITGLIGDSQSGGFWPAELRAAGFDGIIVHGRSQMPVYLSIINGKPELHDARHLWGRFTADVEDNIRQDLGDQRIRVLQCGPAAEKGVLFGALISSSNRANGRTGMGTVMASKNLRAIAVRGKNTPKPVNPEKIKELARWGRENLETSDVVGLGLLGTAGIVNAQNQAGGLPTRNWTSGSFANAAEISGQRMAETILIDRDTCFACIVRCKRVVEVREGSFKTDPRYGGPEYETLATMGSYCGVSDLSAIAHANQLCNMYGMDTITCGATIAWAMDCYEQGLISIDDTGGVDLCFGNAEAMVQMVRLIGDRQGFGQVLGLGSAAAADYLGTGQDLVVAVKKSELPAHMPQVKKSLALVYAVNPFGADHQSHEHDPSYQAYPTQMAELGLNDPQAADGLNMETVRYALRTQYLYSCLDSLCICQFVFGPAWQLYGLGQLVELVHSTTGWNVTVDELVRVGERRLNLLRAFNAREQVGIEADTVPPKLLHPLVGGSSDGVAVDIKDVERAREIYYQMAGWDSSGQPTDERLRDLGLGWVADSLAEQRNIDSVP